jgi:hypothetical protein
MRGRSLGKATSIGSQNQRQSSVQSLVAVVVMGDASLCTSRKTVKTRRMYMRPSFGYERMLIL